MTTPLPPAISDTSTTATSEPRHWRDLPHAPPPGTVLGQRDALADGSATLLQWPAAPATTPASAPASDAASADAPVFRYLLLRSGAQVWAYVNRCAHFGVPLASRQSLLRYEPHQRLTCNVHYAHYRWSDGLCTQGDCLGASLLPIPLLTDPDGTLRCVP